MVTLTADSKLKSFMGACPWSWYMHTMASNRFWWIAWWKTVSAGCGPETSKPDRRPASTTGAMISMSSVPNRPRSLAWGFKPHTAMRGGSKKRLSASWVRRTTVAIRSGVTWRIASANDTWALTWDTATSPVVSIMA